MIMKKMLFIAAMFVATMSLNTAIAQDTKKAEVKKECCTKDAKADKKECCKKNANGEKKSCCTKDAKGEKKACCKAGKGEKKECCKKDAKKK